MLNERVSSGSVLPSPSIVSSSIASYRHRPQSYHRRPQSYHNHPHSYCPQSPSPSIVSYRPKSYCPQLPSIVSPSPSIASYRHRPQSYRIALNRIVLNRPQSPSIVSPSPSIVPYRPQSPSIVSYRIAPNRTKYSAHGILLFVTRIRSQNVIRL